jgi:uncharacterized protein (DUF736 family)
MANEKLGNGYIAPNSKRTNEKAPTHKGKLTIGETKYDIAGWEATNDEGSTYLKISLTAPWVKPEGDVKATQQPKKISSEQPFDDTIPF